MHFRRATARDHLIQVELGCGFPHQSAQIAGQLLTDEIWSVQRLIELVDADGFHSADHVQEFGTMVRCSEEPLGRNRHPLARSDVEGNGQSFPRLRFPYARSTIYIADDDRSEEHTSELQSHLNLVCRL